MEILANRDRLLPALGRTAAVVERRQTLPILGNVLVHASGSEVLVCGTDLEVEVRANFEAEVLSPGETTVPARKFVDIVRNLAEGAEIRLKVSGDRCVLTSGRGRYTLGVLAAGDFPTLQMDPVGTQCLVLEELELKRLLEKTAFAMAQQDVRYYLNGLLLEVSPSGLRAVATDGHRLARVDLTRGGLDVDSTVSAIVPYKTVMELRRQLAASSDPIRIAIGERSIRFESSESTTTSKLVDGRYPDYERVVPVDLTQAAVVDRESLRRALARTAVLSNEKYRGVRLNFEPGVLRLQAHNPEQEEAVEEIELDFVGEPTMIGFNVGYLGDVLSAVDGETVEVRFSDGNSSSIWRGAEAEEETYVVMPMRL